MPFYSTKTYGHEEGWSCAFRQWRANHSHCQLLHGYALSFKFVFAADKLDERGWVMDFGGLKGLKQQLKDTFDHKVAVAGDDPDKALFLALNKNGVASVIIFSDGVGVEKFAKEAWRIADSFLLRHYPVEATSDRRLRVISCECAEHGANSAIYSANIR
jgi:6-pyruvoyltetrahydropterin/6-carboxytetrahydropterin synthase